MARPSASGRSHLVLRWSVIALGLSYPIALILVALAFRFVGERLWFTAAAMYLPRLGFALPLPFIAAAVWRWAPRWVRAAQLVAVYVLIVPLMGFTFGSSPSAASEAPRIRVVSYNIGKSGDRFPAALAQIRQFSPDIVVLQAVYEREESALKAEFRGWTLHVEGQWVMATRFPLREAWVPPPLMYAAGSGGARFVRYTLETPLGPVDVFSAHTTSPREALDGLLGDGVDDMVLSGRLFDPKVREHVEFNAYRRQRQIAGIAEAATASPNPVIIAGDTNLPGLSWIYGEHLSSFRDCFTMVGRGFGYTFPASHPWMRIDRILTNRRLRPVDFRVGAAIAAEHLCIFAELAGER